MGVIEGGVIDHQLREIEVECLAVNVPESLVLDITELDIGQSLHVRDLVAVEDVTVLTDPKRAVVAVHQPRVVKSAEEEAAELEAAEAEALEEGAEGAEGEAAEGEGEE